MVAAFFPHKWLGVGIAAVEVVVDRRFKFGYGAEHAAPDLLVGDFGEVPLDEERLSLPGRRFPKLATRSEASRIIDRA